MHLAKGLAAVHFCRWYRQPSKIKRNISEKVVRYHGLPEIANPMRWKSDAVQMAKDMEKSGQIIRKVNSSRRRTRVWAAKSDEKELSKPRMKLFLRRQLIQWSRQRQANKSDIIKAGLVGIRDFASEDSWKVTRKQKSIANQTSLDANV